MRIKLITIFRSILFLLLTTFLFSCKEDNPEIDYNKAWVNLPSILERIQPPIFTDKDFNIIDFGALPNADNDNRIAIQNAIEHCASEGGGKVIVPPGKYIINGPIHLKSNVNLHLQNDSYLKFSVNPDDYLPMVLVRWEGTRCYNYSPLIYAYQQENIAITGEGTIDGSADDFWMLWKLIQEPDKSILRYMGKRLVPVEERLFGKGHFLRPTLIEPYECKNVLIEGVTVKNSPFWTIHPILCENVIIRKVTIQKGMSNDDGCDPESCNYVLIEDCTFETNDDNIAIKAGRDNDAWIENGGKPSENIVIRNNKFIYGHVGAITIGSEMSGGVRNVFVENNFIQKTGQAFFIKSNTDRGGKVENIYFRNNKIDTCKNQVVFIQLDYKGAAAGNYPADFNNFYFENITCEYSKLGLKVFGLPGKPISNIVLDNFTIETLEKQSEIYFVNEFNMKNFRINKLNADPKEFYAIDTKGEEREGRLYWKDLPIAVQTSFLKLISDKIDKIKHVSEGARQDVKNAFKNEPMVNDIQKVLLNNVNTYFIKKDFNDESISASISENGIIIK